MNTHQWEELCLRRGRVHNIKTNVFANLVDWMPGAYCKVFTGYDPKLAGIVRMPLFATWKKTDVELAANEIPIAKIC